MSLQLHTWPRSYFENLIFVYLYFEASEYFHVRTQDVLTQVDIQARILCYGYQDGPCLNSLACLNAWGTRRQALSAVQYC